MRALMEMKTYLPSRRPKLPAIDIRFLTCKPSTHKMITTKANTGHRLAFVLGENRRKERKRKKTNKDKENRDNSEKRQKREIKRKEMRDKRNFIMIE